MNSKTNLFHNKTAVIGLILTIALIGFELFNFDTTRFALSHLMGGRRFLGLEWAAVLALAFGSLDFAGLVRVFTPEQSLKDEPTEIWWMTGAWLLGASLNALMTWYAMVLLIAPLGVEIGATLFTHEQVLLYAPPVIALLVWLTRISLISSVALALERLAVPSSPERPSSNRHNRGRNLPTRQPIREQQPTLAFSENGCEEIVCE